MIPGIWAILRLVRNVAIAQKDWSKTSILIDYNGSDTLFVVKLRILDHAPSPLTICNDRPSYQKKASGKKTG